MAITAQIINQSRAIQVLQGYLKGIASDKVINDLEFRELKKWLDNHKDLADLYPFSDLYVIVEKSLADNMIDPSEAQELLDFCNDFEALNGPVDKLTAEMRTLHGYVYGIIVDNKVNENELNALRKWMDARSYYNNKWPFNEIYSFITKIMEDKKVTAEENTALVEFFSNFAEVKADGVEAETALYNRGFLQSDAPVLETIDYIIDRNHDIRIEGSAIVLTGQFECSKRADVEARIVSNGGILHKSVRMDTDYIVIGALSNRCWAYSTYGRKIEKAQEFIQKYQSKIIFLDERDFISKLN